MWWCQSHALHHVCVIPVLCTGNQCVNKYITPVKNVKEKCDGIPQDRKEFDNSNDNAGGKFVFYRNYREKLF
jgi:hypothetical protein